VFEEKAATGCAVRCRDLLSQEPPDAMRNTIFSQRKNNLSEAMTPVFGTGPFVDRGSPPVIPCIQGKKQGNSGTSALHPIRISFGISRPFELWGMKSVMGDQGIILPITGNPMCAILFKLKRKTPDG